MQDLAGYAAYTSDDDESRMIQPCVAAIEHDGKFDESSDIFGTYNITLGMRIYANESDTAPLSLPDQTFQADFTMYETDLSNIYEEKDVPEEKAAEVVYIDKKFKKRITTSFPNFSGDEKFYWLRVKGGYKLYGASDAEDKFFY